MTKFTVEMNEFDWIEDFICDVELHLRVYNDDTFEIDYVDLDNVVFFDYDGNEIDGEVTPETEKRVIDYIEDNIIRFADRIWEDIDRQCA